VVTSCVTAYVSGEHVWSPRVFAARIGGYGLKFHSTRHRDLYHWLLGDSTYFAHGITYDLPLGRSSDHTKPPRGRNLENFSGTSDPDEAKRPLVAPWLEPARLGNHSQGVFELRFGKEHSITCQSLSRPNNVKAISEILSQITVHRNKAFVFSGEPPLISMNVFQGGIAQNLAASAPVTKALSPVLSGK
jgi:hypothetical protein